jgi:hypothetical protein
MFDRAVPAAVEADAAARAIELAEQLLECVTGARRDWQAVGEAASELAALADGRVHASSAVRGRP